MSEERGHWKDNFEIYTRRCLEYFAKKEIGVKLTVLENNIDVRAELQKPEMKPRSRKEIEKQRRAKKS
jgi:hypothetical protein